MQKQGGSTGDEGLGTALMDATALSANDSKVVSPPKATAGSYPELKPDKSVAKAIGDGEPAWFKVMTGEEKRRYLAAHPGSHFTKCISKTEKCECCSVLNKDKTEKSVQLDRIQKSIGQMSVIEPLAKTSVVKIFKPLFAKSRNTTDLDKAMGKLRKMLDDWKPGLK